MTQVFGWFMFGMFVWGCCILMQAFQNRFAPELKKAGLGLDERDLGLGGLGLGMGRRRRKAKAERREAEAEPTAKDAEIAELRKRVEVLEAIVTDPKFQWEQDLRR